MDVADLLHSLTVDGLTLRVGADNSLEVVGDVSKLTLIHQQALSSNKQVLLSMLSPPPTCFFPSLDDERDAIRFADTPVAMASLKEAIRFFDSLIAEMHRRNPKALTGVLLEPDASQTPCKRCKGTRSLLVVIHAGESLRRDCAKCGFFRDFPAWNNKLLAEEILARTFDPGRYNEKQTAQVVRHLSSPNESLCLRKEYANG